MPVRLGNCARGEAVALSIHGRLHDRLTEELRLKPFRAPGPRVWAGGAGWLAWRRCLGGKGRRLALRCWSGFISAESRAGEPSWLFRSCIVMQGHVYGSTRKDVTCLEKGRRSSPGPGAVSSFFDLGVCLCAVGELVLLSSFNFAHVEIS